MTDTRGVPLSSLYGGKRAEKGKGGMRFRVFVGDDCVGYFDDYEYTLSFVASLGSTEVTIEDTHVEGARLLLLN